MDDKKKAEIRDKTVELLEQIGFSESSEDNQAAEKNHRENQ
jgi:hypothetical protein